MAGWNRTGTVNEGAWTEITAAWLALIARCGPHAPETVEVHAPDGRRAVVARPRPGDPLGDVVDRVRAAGPGDVPAVAGISFGRHLVADTRQLWLHVDGRAATWSLSGSWAHPSLLDHLPGALRRVLAALRDDPARTVAEAPVLGEAEEGFLRAVGAPTPGPDDPALVHQRVEAQARQHPQALACGRASERLTYGELNARANQLARALRECGAGRDRTVALLLERSPEMLISFLAVFKSGAAAILLDPAHPPTRLAGTLADVRPVAVLNLARLGLAVPPTSATVIGVDTEWPRIHRLDPADLDLPIHPDDIAYVVHTSGSTGRPKRVAVVHRSVAHSIGTHQLGHCIEPADRASWLAPPGSSVSVGELWPYLSTGASVHIAEPETVGSPERLRDWLVAERITKSFVSMPMAEQLYLAGWPAGAALRLLTVGSDKVRRWAPADRPFEVAVACGSSEANGISSCLLPWTDRLTSWTANEQERAAPPPVGRVWPGVRVEVLDSAMRRLLPGTTGEMYVGGPELARGYLGDSGQTADRFRPDPFRSAGARLYRTGDLAFFDPAGRLHHCGRVDREMKIRGFRVDPGEVESALLALPGVREAVVVAAPDESGENRLCAYLVATGADLLRLRESLAATLPAHAVPASFTPLDAMPVTTNGKIDRRALPAPDFTALRPDYREPQDELERAVAEIWTELLQIDPIGRDDNFFHLGGDSLTANRLTKRLLRRLGARVTLRATLEHPTVEGLAAHIRDRVPHRVPVR
ncbi:non-ribosomal peptide synthetase [Paractinoplanes hotanensis]|uniref:Non-ribosomal peptide synthetase n=1 Tax=Paractinoplanes hotanensis TaxID=2906497 RepID=A0ABT0YAN1_9ACTN|nr:non-ribosomal peptide synthetase [Actinoplanes hotanensis]MCM4083096.1 non-ribosomal peptide synthetase [Actinoplanes hotanensis]